LSGSVTDSIRHLALDEGHAIHRQGIAMAEDEVVEHDDTLVLVEQVTDGVGADVAGAAGDEKGSLGHGQRYSRKEQD